MADNLALKLLVAGIVGAVVGASASERFRLPAGLVYGGFSKPTTGRGMERPDDPPRTLWRSPPDWPDWPSPDPQPRWRGTRSQTRTALCWREYEDWDFGTTGYYVRCPPGGGGRNYRPRGNG
jgi:hypothetical protein